MSRRCVESVILPCRNCRLCMGIFVFALGQLLPHAVCHAGNVQLFARPARQRSWGRSTSTNTTATKTLTSPNCYQSTAILENMYLCEPGLWTSWKHKGDLAADTHSVSMELSAEKVEASVRHRHAASIHALLHARHFVWRRNHAQVSADSTWWVSASPWMLYKASTSMAVRMITSFSSRTTLSSW